MSGRGEAQSDSLVARPLLKLSTSRRASIVGDKLPDTQIWTPSGLRQIAGASQLPATHDRDRLAEADRLAARA